MQATEPQAEKVAQKVVEQIQGQLTKLVKNNYVLMGQIRVTYKFEAIAFPQSDKIEMFFAADDKLLEVKNRLDKLLGHNFYFFLNQSFMPSFDAKIGDLAKCYGRMDSETKRYEIKLTACQSNFRYG